VIERGRRAKANPGRGLAGITEARIGDAFDPQGYFVYLLLGADGYPMYVGQSSNILARLGSHMADPVKRDLSHRVTVLRCETKAQMDDTERRLIQHYPVTPQQRPPRPPPESTGAPAPVYSHPPQRAGRAYVDSNDGRTT
jgi:hypothetical protein